MIFDLDTYHFVAVAGIVVQKLLEGKKLEGDATQALARVQTGNDRLACVSQEQEKRDIYIYIHEMSRHFLENRTSQSPSYRVSPPTTFRYRERHTD